MLPNKTLIDALRNTASIIEEDHDNYNWNDPAKCNVGLLAQYLTGLDESELETELGSIRIEHQIDNNSWSELCTALIGKETEVDLLQTIYSFGLNREDIIYLEYFGEEPDPYDSQGKVYIDPEFVSDRFRLIATELESALAK